MRSFCKGLDAESALRRATTKLADRAERTLALATQRGLDPESLDEETLLALYQNRTSLPVVEIESGRLVGIVSHWGVGMAVLGRDGGPRA